VAGVLTCRPGVWSNRPTIKYQWLRSGAPIRGALAASYRATTSDYAKRLSCRVTATNAGGSVVALTGSLPVGLGLITNTLRPAIIGKAKVGNRLTASPGRWSPSATAYSFRWYRNGVAIKGATKSTYKVVKADKKRKLTVKVTAKRAYYASASKVSAYKKAY
jgi:hypothetical protein